jgi:plastocyanin
MIIKFYPLMFIMLLLLFINSYIDPKIYAVSIVLNNPQTAEKEQATSSNNTINIPTSKDTENNIFIYGIVDSSFSISKKSLWIATGNWSVTLKNNAPAFDLNMTWFNNNGSASRTYHIFDFKPFYAESGLLPNNILLTNGTASISLNNHTEYNIPITINIEKNKIMSVYYNDDVFNRHFGNQPLHGIATSVIIKNNTNSTIENPITASAAANNQINQKKSIDTSHQNLLSNNGILPNDTTNHSNTINNDINNGNGNLTLAPPTTTTTTAAAATASISIVIPENAGLLGNPSYSPQIAKINQGDKLLVINHDKTYHTVSSISNENTNNPQIGNLYDSGMISPQKDVIVDTSKLNPGNYQFECSIHPFMKGTLIVE